MSLLSAARTAGAVMGNPMGGKDKGRSNSSVEMNFRERYKNMAIHRSGKLERRGRLGLRRWQCIGVRIGLDRGVISDQRN